MELEQFYVFNIDSPLTSTKRAAIEAEINLNANAFGRDVSLRWLKRGEEKFLRLTADPVTVEIVFFDDRVELYGAAPAWARLLLTQSLKDQLRERIGEALRSTGFITAV
jgi:hypothetical protein